jgi:hypothetical protein
LLEKPQKRIQFDLPGFECPTGKITMHGSLLAHPRIGLCINGVAFHSSVDAAVRGAHWDPPQTFASTKHQRGFTNASH